MPRRKKEKVQRDISRMGGERKCVSTCLEKRQSDKKKARDEGREGGSKVGAEQVEKYF